MIKILKSVPIFNRSVVFIGGCSKESASHEIFKLRGLGTVVQFSENSDGGVRSVGGDVYVWVADLNCASVVAHELAHAAVSIMDVCNIPLCTETEELMCYLVGWLKVNIQDSVYERFSDVD